MVGTKGSKSIYRPIELLIRNQNIGKVVYISLWYEFLTLSNNILYSKAKLQIYKSKFIKVWQRIPVLYNIKVTLFTIITYIICYV